MTPKSRDVLFCNRLSIAGYKRQQNVHKVQEKKMTRFCEIRALWSITLKLTDASFGHTSAFRPTAEDKITEKSKPWNISLKNKFTKNCLPLYH